MAAAGMAGGRWRLNLAELAGLVGVAALTAAALRRPRIDDASGTPLPGPTLGLALVGLGMLTAAVLARQAWRRREAGLAAAWPIAWRVIAVTLIGLFVAREGSHLRDVPLVNQAATVWTSDSWRRPFHSGFTPACGLLGALGLALGLAPAPRRRAGDGAGGGLVRAWTTVMAAGLAGLGLLSLAYGPISALVLIAIEAVRNALQSVPMPERRYPGLARRLDETIPAVLAAAAACTITAAWLSAELRSGADAAWSRVGRVARALSVLATAAAGLWLMTVTLPRLSRPLYEGLGPLLDSADWTTLAAGLVVLALGLAARATAPRPEFAAPAAPSPRWRLARALILVAIVVLLFDGVRFALAENLGPLVWPGPEAGDPPRVPRWLATRWAPWPSWYERWVHESGLPAQIINGYTSPAPNPWKVLLLDPANWPLLLAAGWLLALIVTPWLLPRPDTPPAFDAVGTDRHRAARFLAIAVGFAVLLAAALPTFLLGMLIVGYRSLRLGDP